MESSKVFFLLLLLSAVAVVVKSRAPQKAETFWPLTDECMKGVEAEYRGTTSIISSKGYEPCKKEFEKFFKKPMTFSEQDPETDCFKLCILKGLYIVAYRNRGDISILSIEELAKMLENELHIVGWSGAENERNRKKATIIVRTYAECGEMASQALHNNNYYLWNEHYQEHCQEWKPFNDCLYNITKAVC